EETMTIVGGLSLDGAVPPMRGLLPIAVASRRSDHLLMFPRANETEAGVVDGLKAMPVRSLVEAVRRFVDPRIAPPARVVEADGGDGGECDMADVRGQAAGRRALEVAAAGGHHLLLSG